jgi:hypothetical protein
MPEAFAVLFVFVIAVTSYVGARLHAANPDNWNPAEDLTRLKQYRAWLQERREQAGRENWDQAMRNRISDEIAEAELALAKATASNNR